jgi:hypothetical protein
MGDQIQLMADVITVLRIPTNGCQMISIETRWYEYENVGIIVNDKGIAKVTKGLSNPPNHHASRP